MAMTTQQWFRAFGSLAACAMVAITPRAQTPATRIRSEISNVAVSPLTASQQPLGSTQYDAGRMASDARLTGMSIVFNRSASQEADLQALMAAQQDPNSPQYHQWLSPEQFGARFGMAQSDIDKVQTWLQQQGFAIDSVARGRNMIRFSGTVGQLEQAFQTQMHYFKSNGETHFAPASLLSVPTAIAPTIAAVRNVSDFRPRPMHVSTHRAFTSGQSGNVFFAPGDIATTYDIGPLYTAGVDGTGQSIAIVGQSAVLASDIEAFETAAGLPKKDPVMVLVPGSGSSTVVAGGDEGESDLDIEWAGAIAKGATIDFVYTGNGGNKNAFDSIVFAIDENIAPIISVSYGACETALGGFSLETQLAQAALQGQTVLAASGDQGSTACSGDTQNGLTTTQQFALAVNYPASSPNVTAVGGTEIPAADGVDPNTGTKGANYSTYWSTNGTNDVLTSVKTYIPEIAWNDDSTQFGLGASGGGASTLFARPSWQTGVTGIPSGTKRLVPDVSLYSSAALPGYLFCSSDQSNWNTTNAPLQAASCNSGFRDSTSQDLTVAGGTSFATPIFAGMIALINQMQDWPKGQGLANPMLYTLAAGANYSTLFHDVTSGNNNCTAGATSCGTTTTGFSAGTGYDEVTGLGSVDVAVIAAAWLPKGTSTLISTKTTASAANTAPNVSTNDIITITVAQVGGTATPTGTVNLSIDGSGPYNGAGSTTTPVTLTNGTATYTANFATAGAHTIVAQYAGDAANAPSTGAVQITVQLLAATATPSFSPPAGTYSTSQTVTINDATNGATIYFTTNGTAPTTSSTVYSSPITVSTSETVKAIALANGFSASAVGSASYTISQVTTGAAQGAYFGTASNGETFEAIILPNNTLYALYGTTTGNVFNVLGLITGPGSSSNGSYSASITDYNYAGGVYTGSVSASYVSGASINGTIIDSGVGVLSFSGSVLPSSEYNFNAQASLSTIIGTWNGALLGGIAASATIVSTGTFSGSSQGCSYSGNITPDSSGMNFFDFSLKYGASPCLLPNQTQTGIAIDYLLSNGSTRQLLGAVSSGSSGNVFIANGTAGSTSPTFSLSATASTITRGSSGTSTVTIGSTNNYAGTITLSCALTSSPAGATDLPTCSSSQTVTLSSSATSRSTTLTLSTTAASSALALPKLGNGGKWAGASSGTLLAMLIVLRLPKRRRYWQSTLGIVLTMAILGGLAACGGGGGSGGSGGGRTNNPGTTGGAYTFTVTGAGSDSAKTTGTTTFVLTVN